MRGNFIFNASPFIDRGCAGSSRRKYFKKERKTPTYFALVILISN